jgi:hypothetical protein
MGMVVVAIYFTNMTLYMFTYSFKTEILDNGTRSFLNSAFADDMMHCEFSPLIIIFGSLDAQRFVKEFLTKPLFV